MSVRLHTAKKYQIKYGTSIDRNLTDKITKICHNSEGGWVSEDGTDMEISIVELERAIAETTDEDLKDALQLILKEHDKKNDFARLALF